MLKDACIYFFCQDSHKYSRNETRNNEKRRINEKCLKIARIQNQENGTNLTENVQKPAHGADENHVFFARKHFLSDHIPKKLSIDPEKLRMKLK